MEISFEERVSQVDNDSWKSVGGYLRRALAEVSYRIGGENFMEEIMSSAGDPDENIFPDPVSFLLINKVNPEGSQMVINRAEEMQMVNNKY